MALLLVLQATHSWTGVMSILLGWPNFVACGLQLTSTRAPLLMLRGAARLEASCMRPLEAWSMPVALVAAKLLGAAEVLALVLTLAVSLKVRRNTGTQLRVYIAGKEKASIHLREASPRSNAWCYKCAQPRTVDRTVLAC